MNTSIESNSTGKNTNSTEEDINETIDPFKYFTEASINSLKLCGNIFVDNPTAIPSAPCANNKGNITGRFTGSFLLPS